MAVYVTMHTNKWKKARATGVYTAKVRRPLRGIEIRDDTYAVIRVIQSDGTEIPLIDSRPVKQAKDQEVEHGATFDYANFIISNITESRSEKAQVIENFGEPYIFFFGERPRMLQVSGTLLNTVDFNWKDEFWRNYEKYLRGTRLVEMNARVYLYYEEQLVEGYLFGASATQDAQQPYHVPFNFTMFVTAHIPLGEILTDDSQYPVSAGVTVPVDELRKKISGGEVKKTSATDPLQHQSSVDAVQRAAANTGFGSSTLVSALLSGVQDPAVDGVLSAASSILYKSASGGVSVASLPLRSKISDNADEYINYSPVDTSAGTTQQSQANLSKKGVEQANLTTLNRAGADLSDSRKLGEALNPDKMSSSIVSLGMSTEGGVGELTGVDNAVGVLLGQSLGPLAQQGAQERDSARQEPGGKNFLSEVTGGG